MIEFINLAREKIADEPSFYINLLTKITSVADIDIAFHFCTENLLGKIFQNSKREDSKNLYVIYGNIASCGVSLRQSVVLSLTEEFFKRVSYDL